ncbi:DUF4326 domain-containing protein [Kitasatospora sp. NPDC001175]|uniref:DUF4326 domain-containing protein n=1 Tax=Kitasatospora sp. NPDC001175 TaxID=3157103 RepID=UPI003D013ECC
MTAPRRIQRRRTAGWRAPLDEHGRTPVYVGRGTRWGNPWAVVRQADSLYGIPPAESGNPWPTYHLAADARAEAVRLYRAWLAERPQLISTTRRVLAGRDLMCWCPDPEPGQPDHCHAAHLLRLANPELEDAR